MFRQMLKIDFAEGHSLSGDAEIAVSTTLDLVKVLNEGYSSVTEFASGEILPRTIDTVVPKIKQAVISYLKSDFGKTIGTAMKSGIVVAGKGLSIMQNAYELYSQVRGLYKDEALYRANRLKARIHKEVFDAELNFKTCTVRL